jgi:hypothetical protein
MARFRCHACGKESSLVLNAFVADARWSRTPEARLRA